MRLAASASGHRPEIDEFIEGACEAACRVAAVLRSMRIAMISKARLVVAFEEFSYEKRRRVTQKSADR